MTAPHEIFTRMLFTDAIFGIRASLPASGGATTNRTALEALDIPALQDLYTALKLHEVNHAH